MKPVPMEIVSRTHKGRVRSINEDSIAVLPDFGLAILADGMGGYAAGEVASLLAVQTIAKELIPVVMNPDIDSGYLELEQAVNHANNSIFSAVEQKVGSEGMATTIVVVIFCDDRALFAHLGDSRLYRLSSKGLEQLTSDHSIIQELVDQGMFFSIREAMEAGVPNNVLTRGLGVEQHIRLDIGEAILREEDIYLLCSDGLTNMVSDAQITELIRSNSHCLEQAGDQLIRTALENGGIDNISLVLARAR